MNTPAKKNISILGCGWLGLPLLQTLAKAGYPVRGSSRSPATLRAIEVAGGQAFALDLPGPIPPAFLAYTDVLIITLPPRARKLGSEKAMEVMNTALLPFTQGQAGLTKPEQVIYTSSTSIYGAAAGEVTETTPLDLVTAPSGLALHLAETQLTDTFPNSLVLRLAGLVAADRHPGRFFGGRGRLIPQADAPVNLVHRQDVISAIQLLLEKESTGSEVYNVCAAAHPTKGTYYAAAAAALGLDVAGRQAGGANGKVISSQKLRDLGWQPLWDDLALDALVG